MRVRNVPAAIALLALSACAGEAPGDDASVRVGVDASMTPSPKPIAPVRTWRIVVDPNVPAWEASVVDEALRAWQREIPCDVSFVIERRRVTPIDAMLPPPGVVELQMGKPPGGVGWADWDPRGRFGARLVFLPNETERDRDDFLRVVEHELGHAFHLEHSAEGLMADPPKLGVRVGPIEGTAYASRWCPTST